MQVMFACLADHANSEQQAGKLNVYGIFDSINTSGFPTVHPHMTLVFRLLMEYGDNQKTVPIEIVLRDADHKARARITAEAQCGALAPGEFGTQNLILEFNNVVFPTAGRYHFAVIVDGEETRVPLTLRQQ